MKITRIPENYRELGIELMDPRMAVGKQFPDYLIIGPWRTGTTWLSEVLRGVPGVFMTTPKEPHYFAGLSDKHTIVTPDFLWYLGLFADCEGHQVLCGEASATYAMHLSPELIRFIIEMNPEIKIIFGVRDPIERAWSHAKMNLAERSDEFRHLTANERMKAALSRHHIIDAGYYRKHLAKWKAIIPEKQLLLFEYSELQQNPARALSKVCRFLEVPISEVECEEITKQVGKVAGTERWEMPGDFRRHLFGRYRDEISSLKARYQIEFPDRSHLNKNRPLVLVPKDTLEYSETFISNHIRGLGGIALSIREFMPLLLHKEHGLKKRIEHRLKGRQRLRQAIHRLNQQQAPMLIEYGTTAAMMLPALRHCSVPFVIHFHGFDAYRLKVLEKWAAAYRELFDLASAVIVVSKDMQRKLISLGAPEGKVHHIACGVNPDLFSEADVRHSPPVFFACGRFVDKKAPLTTIRAFHRASQKQSDMRLRFAGEGPLLEDARRLVSDLRLDTRVDFLGAIDQKAVARELQHARAFVQHSVVAQNGDSEGTPVGILEAGCCALPVISTRHGGIPDVVLDGKTGILCAEHDIDGMADAIVRLAANAELAAEMGAAGRLHILKHHTLDQAIARLSGILHIVQSKSTVIG